MQKIIVDVQTGEQKIVDLTSEEIAELQSYIPPPPSVPPMVTMRQARLALLGAGMLAEVNAAISSMTGAEGEAARIEWEYAQEVRRDSPLLAMASSLLWLTDAQIDDLFFAAEKL